MRTRRAQVATTSDFLDAFEHRLLALVAANMHEGEGRSEGDSGAIGEIAREAESYLGDVLPGAMPRRIYSIRQREFKTVNAQLADALMMAFNLSCNEADIPIMAGSETGAREMVDGYDFAKELHMSTFEQKLLAKKLLRFCKGYIEAQAAETHEELVAELKRGTGIKRVEAEAA